MSIRRCFHTPLLQIWTSFFLATSAAVFLTGTFYEPHIAPLQFLGIACSGLMDVATVAGPLLNTASSNLAGTSGQLLLMLFGVSLVYGVAGWVTRGPSGGVFLGLARAGLAAVNLGSRMARVPLRIPSAVNRLLKNRSGLFRFACPLLLLTAGLHAQNLTIVTASPLPNSYVGIPYSLQFAATGGTGAYRWTASGLAPGLSLSASGLLSGTPTIVTSGYVWFIQVSDSAQPPTFAGKSFSHDVISLPQVQTAQLAIATAGQPYNFTLAVTGGAGPFTWSVSGLPAGLVLNSSSTGAISGTPATSGSYTVTATVRDSGNQSGSKSLNLLVLPAPSVLITSVSPLSGTVNTPFPPFTFRASGGSPPYVWSITTGLPPGMIFSSGGTLSGTPATAGNFAFTITARDTNGASDSLPVGLTINDSPKVPHMELTKTIVSAPPFLAGVPFVFQLTAKNSGDGRAYEVQLDDQLPPPIMFSPGSVEATGGTCRVATTTFPTLVCNPLNSSTLEPGQSLTVLIPATQPLPGMYSNFAFLRYQEFASGPSLGLPPVGFDYEVKQNLGPATVFVTKTIVDDLPVDQDGTPHVDTNQVFKFRVKVTNNGPGVASTVILHDFLPSGLSLGAAPDTMAEGGVQSDDANCYVDQVLKTSPPSVTCTPKSGGTLQNGESITIIMTVTQISPVEGVAVNDASVYWRDIDDTKEHREYASAAYGVGAIPKRVSKVDSPLNPGKMVPIGLAAGPPPGAGPAPFPSSVAVLTDDLNLQAATGPNSSVLSLLELALGPAAIRWAFDPIGVGTKYRTGLVVLAPQTGKALIVELTPSGLEIVKEFDFGALDRFLVLFNLFGRPDTFFQSDTLDAAYLIADDPQLNALLRARLGVLHATGRPPAPKGDNRFSPMRESQARAASDSSEVTVGLQPSAMIMADFNGDGINDVAVANAGSNDVSIVLWDGADTLTSMGEFPVGMAPAALVAGDLNGDGALDLIVANGVSGDISILLGDGKGNFAPAVNQRVCNSPSAIATIDLNGDGNLDIAVACSTAGVVALLFGDGTGALAPPVFYPVGKQPTLLLTADVNGDGKPDLVVGNKESRDVVYLISR